MEQILEIPEFETFALENVELVAQWKLAFDRIGEASAFRVTADSPVAAGIYERLALQLVENAEFLDRIPSWSGWPLNPSKIYRKPLIKHDDQFYLFLIPLLFRGALACLEAIIATTDPDYWRRRFLASRDVYLERKSVEQFQRLLPGCRVFTNFFFKHEEGGLQKRSEGDGLIIFDDTLILVEAKAGKISDQARRGALKSLRSDLEAVVDKAYQQASRVLKFIRGADEVTFFQANGDELFRLRFRNFRNVFLVAVSFDALAGLSTGSPLLRRLGMVQGEEWPWSVSIYDLQVIAEICEHPTVFLHYLTWRAQVNAYDKLVSSDELDLLGHYLRRGLYFEGDEEYNDAGFLLLHDVSSQIDDHYQHIMGLGPEVEKPKVVMASMFETLVNTLESARPQHFVSACMAMQDFDDATREKMADAVQQFEARSRADGVRLATFKPDKNRLAVMLSVGKVNTPLENLILDRCREVQVKYSVDKAIAIIWDPPLSNGRIRVFLL